MKKKMLCTLLCTMLGVSFIGCDSLKDIDAIKEFAQLENEEPEVIEDETQMGEETEPESEGADLVTDAKGEQQSEDKEESSEKNKKKESKKKKDKKNSNSDAKFREMLDEYEKFMDEYIAFMEKYKESDGTDLKMLTDYGKLMGQYASYIEKIDKVNEDELSEEDLKYYLEVTGRVSQKLVGASIEQ